MSDTAPILPTVEVQPEMDPVIGLILDGYQVKERMESGGMGLIYRAWHTGIERNAVVKVLKPEMATDTEQVARFHKEARTLGRLKHPNIIEIYGAGVLPDGRLYILTEYLEGQSLHRLMRTRSPLRPLQALGMIEQVLSGLNSAHEQGFIHRDLKPENIFVVPQLKGEPLLKLLDFGLAKQDVGPFSLMEGVQPARSTLAGTPQYISPEQATGQSDKIGPASDLYCVGVIMFEMLAGHLPFQPTAAGDREQVVELLKMHVLKPPPKLEGEGIPASLVEMVERLLQKNPANRYESAAQLKSAVRAIIRELRQVQTDVRHFSAAQLKAINEAAAPKRARPNNTDQIAGAVAVALGEEPVQPQHHKLVVLVLVLLLLPLGVIAAWKAWAGGKAQGAKPVIAAAAPAPMLKALPPETEKRVEVTREKVALAAPVAPGPRPVEPEEDLTVPLKSKPVKAVVAGKESAARVEKVAGVNSVAISEDECAADAAWRDGAKAQLSDLDKKWSQRAQKDEALMAQTEEVERRLTELLAKVNEAKSVEDCLRVRKEILALGRKYIKEAP